MENSFLEGRHILVVEDEYLLADELCHKLAGAGAIVVGPVPSVTFAMALISDEPTIDAALLDVNLGGELVFPVADALVVRSVPFIFTSAYDNSVLALHYALMPRCQKPLHFNNIVRALTEILPDELHWSG